MSLLRSWQDPNRRSPPINISSLRDWFFVRLASWLLMVLANFMKPRTKRPRESLVVLNPFVALIWVLALFWIYQSAFTGATRPFDPPPTARTKYNFNSGWKLLIGDRKGVEAPAF